MCQATASTNGQSVNDASLQPLIASPPSPVGFQTPVSPADRKQPINEIINEAPFSDINLPPTLSPTGPVSGSGGLLFFELDDKKTGVLALSSFQTGGFDQMETQLLAGLQKLKADGISKLVVDIVSSLGVLV